MPKILIVYGEKTKAVQAERGTILGEAIATSGLPFEQPCAGKGTCGKCKVLAEDGVAAPDEIELEHLTSGELSINNRLACRARVADDARVVLSPIVVYSNKIFRGSHRYKNRSTPLGLAIDLGSTTVAAFLVTLDNGEVCAGSASLNQQTVYGADVISRLSAANKNQENAIRLHKLALASINQAVDSLNLSQHIYKRIEKVTIVGNVAMHHLLTMLPVDTIAVKPFQPFEKRAIQNATEIMDGIFPESVDVLLPPLIGGFVGSDALACLAYFGFDKASQPKAVIDLGTNGEVMVTDGKRILTASTAAGPAFEGVNISCGTRAVDGAVVAVSICEGELRMETIGNDVPIGLTGSGLLSIVHQLRIANVIEPNGRFAKEPTVLSDRLSYGAHGSRQLLISENKPFALSQWDIRELQKAKAAIRAAIDILMARLDLLPQDLEQVILTGSFGGQIDINAALALGLIPPVESSIVSTIANGAGFGAAMFLSDEGFQLAKNLAEQSEQIDLDLVPDFMTRYIDAMSF